MHTFYKSSIKFYSRIVQILRIVYEKFYPLDLPQITITISSHLNIHQAVSKNRDGFGPTEGCINVCQCLSHCLHRGSLCAGRYTPIETVVDERRRVNSTTCWVKLKSVKVLRVMCEERQITLCKWKEWLSESFKESGPVC